MSGLNLRGTPVVSKDKARRAQEAFEILGEVQEMVRKMGLPPYPKPEAAPTPLCELEMEALSNQEVAAQMVNYIAYAQYVSTKLAEAEAAYKISEVNLKQIAANLKVALFSDGVAKAEVSARIQDSSEYQKYEQEHLKLFATKSILSAYYKSYSRQAAALSRVVELRKLEFEQEHRANNVNSHKRPGGIPGRLRR